MTRRPAAAGLAVALAATLAAGCSGSSSPNRTGGAGPAPARPAAPDQSAPGAAAESYFKAIAQARFGDACALLAPAVRQRYAAAGRDCPTELAGLFDVPTRQAIGDVTADDDLIRVTGDTAEIPGTALSRTDLPPGSPAPRFPDARATRVDGNWYLLQAG